MRWMITGMLAATPPHRKAGFRNVNQPIRHLAKPGI
jgi:hypothetical protein